MIDLSYLDDQLAPNLRVGVSFDGQRVGIVAYSLSRSLGLFPEYVEHAQTGRKIRVGLVEEYAPEVFAAYQSEDCHLGKMMEILRQLCYHSKGENLVLIEGQEVGRSFLSMELKKAVLPAKVKEFRKTSGRRYTLEEVIAAVLTDIRSEDIRMWPQFEERPERIDLKATLEAIEPRETRITPLQEAFLYGLGFWSCVERRAKYRTGATDFRLW